MEMSTYNGRLPYDLNNPEFGEFEKKLELSRRRRQAKADEKIVRFEISDGEIVRQVSKDMAGLFSGAASRRDRGR